ncbi:MAG TPA: DNA-binding response regulator, partial [Planctomycetes bacterium]|nr:DNA-binding response regulator [Planctomycetota bacterium]
MSKSTVLVVEDEEDILEVIQYNLQQEGYEVACCMDGLQGLEQA